jgi:hypothetical protein
VRASVPLTFASRLHSALAMYRGLALADVSAEYEAAMQSFPVLHLIAASLPLARIGTEDRPCEAPAMGMGTCPAKRRILGEGAGAEDGEV